jgi:hypothetical protein
MFDDLVQFMLVLIAMTAMSAMSAMSAMTALTVAIGKWLARVFTHEPH